jgi:biopolymer transport protein TolR
MGAKLGGGRSRGRRSSGNMSDINITPMVDVMLVLLVIFMVTAPMMTAGVSVDLPKANSKALSQHDDKPLEISMDARGNIFLGEDQLKLAELVEKTSLIAQETPDIRVYIRADNRIDYGKVMEVMAAVNGAGFTKIALITDPNKAK